MTVRSMGKVRFRLWFHKLNIKGFRRKRRLSYPPPGPPHHHGASSPALHSCLPVSAHTLHHRGLRRLSNAAPPPNVLLSPINRKAMDLPFPAACSSSPPARSIKSPGMPAAALSSPNLPAAPGLLDSPDARAHPLIFRSPANYTLNDRVNANRSARADRSIMSSKDDNMQGLLVDCGCRPNLASSFRKTKETLQACGGGSSSFCKSNSAHHTARSPALVQQLDNAKQCSSSRRRDGVEDPIKKGPVNCGQEQQSWERAEAWSVVAKRGDHSDEVLQKKVVLKRRKKKIDPTPANPLFSKQKAALKPPLNEPNHNDTGIQKAMKSGLEDVNHGQGDMKLSSSFRLSTSSRDATVLDSRSNFGWDKEFPSFTSEDAFFSSLERGRPSFSSNSSSEYFDRKLNYATFSSNHANLAPNQANSAPSHVKLPCNDAVITPKKPSIKGSEDVKDSTKRDGLDVAEKGVQFHHDLTGSKHASPLAAESYHGDDVDGDGIYSIEGSPSSVEASENSFGANSTRACISTNHSKKSHNSLVGIKEDCEESNMGARLSNSSRSNSIKAMGVQEINDEANLMSSPNLDYYYHRVQADPHRSERTRRNNTRRGGAPNALIRRAQLQASWKLSEKQVQWQSSDDDEYGSCSSTSISSHHVNNQDRLIARRRRRRRRERSKQGEFNAATLAVSKAAPNMLNNYATCDAAEAKSSSISTTNIKDSTKHTNYATNTRLTESVAVVKCSEDPLVDFRDSMVDMILEKQIYSAEELEELLQCFLSLNSREHHDTIVRAFTQVWEKVFENHMAASLR